MKKNKKMNYEDETFLVLIIVFITIILFLSGFFTILFMYFK
jgi:hypothetical protein